MIPEKLDVPEFECDLSVKRARMMCKLLSGNIASLLDVGCRYGYALQAFSDQLPDARLAGVDIDAFVTDKAREFAPHVEFYAVPADDLPFDDGEFDWVYCAHTLEHCPDIPKVVAELCRVASEGLFIIVPLENDFKHKTLKDEQLAAGIDEPDMHTFNTTDPFVWMDYFREHELMPIFYQFTGWHSDILLLLVKRKNIQVGEFA